MISDEVIFVKPGGRRERDVGKTEDKSSCEQRLSMKLLHCSNFHGILSVVQRWETERSEERRDGERERGRESERE